MPKIRIVAVGKLKEKFWKDACAEYAKRLGAFCKLTLCEVPDVDPAAAGGIEAAKAKEAQAILSHIPAQSHVILLAIEGNAVSSDGLSRLLDQRMLNGASDISFVIGGSDGVDSSVYDRAQDCISLGAITLPHNLARVVVLEQIYRAFKISRNEPYHK